MTPTSFNMKNAKSIIHAVGPNFGNTPTAFKELFDAYYNSLLTLMSYERVIKDVMKKEVISMKALYWILMVLRESHSLWKISDNIMYC